mmetsp:Transcript_9710/g.21048  ORF Transcript_9710/g.21048 Transcript_9710/m.21048 type:complete len:217 (+) Transcript_9710:197-847(+)
MHFYAKYHRVGCKNCPGRHVAPLFSPSTTKLSRWLPDQLVQKYFGGKGTISDLSGAMKWYCHSEHVIHRDIGQRTCCWGGGRCQDCRLWVERPRAHQSEEHAVRDAGLPAAGDGGGAGARRAGGYVGVGRVVVRVSRGRASLRDGESWGHVSEDSEGGHSLAEWDAGGCQGSHFQVAEEGSQAETATGMHSKASLCVKEFEGLDTLETNLQILFGQ